jgi:hypothetical protein
MVQYELFSAAHHRRQCRPDRKTSHATPFAAQVSGAWTWRLSKMWPSRGTIACNCVSKPSTRSTRSGSTNRATRSARQPLVRSRAPKTDGSCNSGSSISSEPRHSKGTHTAAERRQSLATGASPWISLLAHQPRHGRNIPPTNLTPLPGDDAQTNKYPRAKL